MTTVDAVSAYVRDAEATFLADLDAWLRVPSISADPAHGPDVRASAAWLADACRSTGFPVVEIWETAGQPAVFAEWRSADAEAPAVLVYGHHDVQPVDPVELWQTSPFEPTRRGDALVGRGAGDDKGQVLLHLLGVRAHLAATGRGTPRVHLKLLVEGEEESGSPHFAQLLRERRDRLGCDVVVVSDTAVFDRNTPSVCTGMRGLTDCQIDVYGPDTDVHSGSFGGAVPNPLHALAALITGLHDERGRVTLPGFYDRVSPLTDTERALFARLPFDEATFLATAGSRATAGEQGFTTLERIWARPTAEVNGIWGGYRGPGHKTIIPASAHGKVSFRLVHDQRPAEVQEMVRRYVAEHLPPGIRASVRFEGPGVRPCLTPLDTPALRAATTTMERAFGQPVLVTREGGSGPQADLADVLGAPVVFVGVGLPDDRIHAPNERVDIPMLLTGARAVAHLWDELPGALR